MTIPIDDKKELAALGLLGNKFRQTQSGSYLFYSDWIRSNFEKGHYPSGLPWSSINISETPEIFYLDQANTYDINDLGFRSKDFKEGTDLVFSGCSFTFGIGLPEDVIWGVQIAKELGMEYSNLGLPGDSVAGIVTNIYQYFKKYGHPKILLCMFPDFYRTIIPENSDVLVSTINNTNSYHALTKLSIINQNWPKYSKKPHDVQNVISPDIPFYYSMQYIKMLEQYCKMAGIKFFWSTWSSMLYSLLNKQNNFSDSFLYVESNQWEFRGAKDVYLLECDKHDYLKEIYPDNFDMATDVEDAYYYDKKSWHSGVHRHTHWKEYFLEAINDNSRN